jgi:addiction module RelE/StbE family toxin
MKALRWMPQAAQDLERIADYLRINAPHAESELVDELFDGINELRFMPYQGRPGKRSGERQLIFVRIRYLVTYRVTDSAIQVMRIRHSSEKPLRF